MIDCPELGVLGRPDTSIRWGSEDVRPIRGGSPGELSNEVVASYVAKYKSDMRDVGGEMAAYVRPGDLVISGQPDQVALAWYYLPSGLRWADLTGPVKDPRYFNWVDALSRLQHTNTQATVARLVASLRVGQQLLFVRPLTEGAKNWEAPWTQLVRRRAAQWGALLSADRALQPVAVAPHNYRGSSTVGDSAVLYRKIA